MEAGGVLNAVPHPPPHALSRPQASTSAANGDVSTDTPVYASSVANTAPTITADNAPAIASSTQTKENTPNTSDAAAAAAMLQARLKIASLEREIADAHKAASLPTVDGDGSGATADEDGKTQMRSLSLIDAVLTLTSRLAAADHRGCEQPQSPPTPNVAQCSLSCFP